MLKNFGVKHSVIIIVSLLLLDQVTKYLTKTYFQLGESVEIIGDFFRLTYVENPGMAFGLRMENTAMFLLLSLFAAGLVFYYMYKLRNESWPLQTAIAMIAAGAIGNLSDRFIRGSVVDFMDFEFFDITIPAFSFLGFEFSGYPMTRWPVFNVADMAVSCGMIIIFSYIIIKGDPEKAPARETESTQTNPNAG
jgi:signal peptidase II